MTKIPNPCTSIAFNIVQHKDKIIELYLNNNADNAYFNEIRAVIKKAANRKQSNPEIKREGEYLNEHTIQKDFENIWMNSQYQEYQVILLYTNTIIY